MNNRIHWTALTAAWALVVAVAATVATGVAVASETENRLRADIEFLASHELEGRLTGSEGARQAADYLAAQLTTIGAEPLPGDDDFFHPFEFVAGAEDLGSAVSRGEQSFGGPMQVSGLAFSEAESVTAEVVFAGYGLSIPEGQDFPYDSYAGIDVEGKIALVLRYFPEDADTDSKKILARYSGLRYKALQAREAGAVGLLVVAGPNSPNAGKTVRGSMDATLQGSGIVAATVSGEVADWLLEPSGRSLAEVQTELDSGNPHVSGFDLPGGELTLGVQVERKRADAHNVVAVLRGSDERAGFGPVVIGAHFDHLGHGEGGNSLASSDETGAVHPGADDNASGVAGVLELARRWSDRERGRDLVVAFWSGEELGLLGSQAFATDDTLLADTPAAYVNFDMIGRMRDDRLTLQSVGSSPVWSQWIESANVPVGLDLTLQEDPYLPTDSTAFYNREVPALSFFTGSHEDYHRPSDKPETLNYEGLAAIVDLADGVVRRALNADQPLEYVKVERQQTGPAGRDGVRAYTGTIPNYASDVEGLLLSGVMAGGPAEAAGLEGGDVIVEFAGQEIRNIYDYTYALDAVKIGEGITVVYERDGERHETELVPTARE